jgi:outer membrane protein OmpA-like peptidoglycan-associated protein
MRTKAIVFVVATLAFSGLNALGQTSSDPQPIYRVTVVSRTLQAINYEHRSGPTKIDFEGTVLLPKAKGDATVESKRGRISIDAKFHHIDPPTKYGREYLTYVLWAITPEGRPKNLGEVMVDPSNNAKLSVTTELQALGLIVTAEPYYSVTTPSDVVVLENVVRPDTIGRVENVSARYDLLPRGQYTMTVDARQLRSVEPEGEKLPYDRYEALLELYQAENAVQIARSLGADRYAPESIGKAQSLLSAAQDMQARKQDTHMIVSRAREATQMAEDARIITVKRRDEDRLSRERQQEQEESRARMNAEAAAQQARIRAADDRAAAEAAQAEAARAEAARAEAARIEAQAEAERARAVAAQPTVAPVVTTQPHSSVIEGEPAHMQLTAIQRQNRADLLVRSNAFLTTRDTPRGLVITLSESSFDSNGLRPWATDRLARVATLIASHRGLGVHVEGYMDDRGSDAEQQAISERRARYVRDSLVTNGVAPAFVVATGFGKARPLASSATAAGREQNRRVEIVISGESIGGIALWDKTYSLTSRH